MLIKTRGVVFHTIKYSESSIITKIYTESLGLQSYIVNGIRVSGSKNKASLFQPFNILELEVYKREHKAINRLREFKIGYIFRSLPFNIVKGSLALFLVEVLNAVFREEERNRELYQFIEESIILLDKEEAVDSNFHLRFLLQLTRHLGFFPGGAYEASLPYFDLVEGCYVTEQPPHTFYLKPPESQVLSACLSEDTPLLISSKVRKNLLAGLLQYYELHVANFKAIKSHKVLEEVFGG